MKLPLVTFAVLAVLNRLLQCKEKTNQQFDNHLSIRLLWLWLSFRQNVRRVRRGLLFYVESELHSDLIENYQTFQATIRRLWCDDDDDQSNHE